MTAEGRKRAGDHEPNAVSVFHDYDCTHNPCRCPTGREQSPAERGRGPMVRHGDHFVIAEPEPMHEGRIGKWLSRIARWVRRG